MTQSGQGEEPSARIPREGIVLPSDGGAPLLPGDQQGPPAPGRSWDEPWGPDPSAAPAPPPAQPWSAQEHPQTAAPAQEWGGQGWGTPPSQAHLHPQQAHPQSPYEAQQAHLHQQQAHPQPPYEAQQAQQPQYDYQAPHAPGSLPSEGAQESSYGTPAYPGPEPAGSLPPQAGPLPPQAGVLDRQTADPLPQQPSAPRHGAQGAPPAPVDEGATQYIPPVASHSADEAATQYLPPVGPGALPPEVTGTPGASSDETQRLGRLPRPGAAPMPPAGPLPGAGPLPPTAGPGNPAFGSQGNPDAEATQYIPPVPPQSYGTGGHPGAAGERPAPDVFDSLFRSGPGGEGAGATQQLPRFEPPPGGQGPQDPYGTGGRAAARHDGSGERGRAGSRVPLIVVVGVGIAALGIGAGALLSKGGGDDKQDDNKPVAAAASDTESSPSADPAREQAVALDKLLADSGDSRTTVINAVANIRRCDNLAKAAADLRTAAQQRNDLVTRLSGLSVDKLPNHAALTTALTSAWKASAAADNHYAAWADQTGGKKGCRKGQARTTPQTQAGNRASTTASTEKNKAAKLWNSIASGYGLTERSPTQL